MSNVSTRRPPPTGWTNINLNKPEEYSSEFVVSGVRYANVTNVSTGQRQLYFVSGLGGTPFTQRSLIQTTNSNGRIIKGEAYDTFIERFGQDSLINAEINNKRQANNIIKLAATPKELKDLSATKEYKSIIRNVAGGPGTTPPGEPAGEDQEGGDGSSGGGGGGGGGEDKAEVDLTELSPIKGRNVRKTYGNYRYPSTLNNNLNNKQDVIKFTMFEYTPTLSFNKGAEGTEGAAPPEEGSAPTPPAAATTPAATPSPSSFSLNRGGQTGARRGSVTLPIQPTITDTNSVSWQQDSLNPLELAAIDASKGFIEDGAAGLTKAIDKLIGSLGSEGENVKTGLKAGALSLALGKNLLARTTGAILNPNVELLFNAPSLRTFSYSFKLSARNKDDSRAIQQIIRFFKQGMSVQRSEAELFLVTPDIFKIEYLLKETDDVKHPYINRIKTCALTSCSVDYTPTGSYMTFTDGAMVSYTLNLTFEELEPVYHDEYELLKPEEIGY
jgi:hypothetical protein